jgi:hypothetical protein
MSDLLLDDIGLLLLRDLYDINQDFRILDAAANYPWSFVWRATDAYADWRTNSHIATDAYMAHLRFIRDTPSYNPRLTHRLKHYGALETRDIAGIIKLLTADSPTSLTHRITWLSLEYYRWYMGIPQPG